MAETNRVLEFWIKAKDAAGEVINRVRTSFDNLGQSVERSASPLRSFETALYAAVGSGMAVNKIVELMDAFLRLEVSLRSATKSEEEHAAALQSVYSIANESRTSLESTGNLYGKITQNADQLGLKQSQVAELTTAVAKGMHLSGAGTMQANAAILQLTQAFASGVLRGDEFRSVMENSPALMRKVAEGLGVPVGALREMAEQGQLTADVVAQSILSQKEAIDSMFATLPQTIGQSMTQLENEAIKFTGTFDKMHKVSGFLGEILAGLGKNIDVIASVIGGAFVAAMVKGTASIATWITASIQSIGVAERHAAATLQSAQAQITAAESALSVAQAQQRAAQAEMVAAEAAHANALAQGQQATAELAGTEAAAAHATAQSSQTAAQTASAETANANALAQERQVASELAGVEATGAHATAQARQTTAQASSAETANLNAVAQERQAASEIAGIEAATAHATAQGRESVAQSVSAETATANALAQGRQATAEIASTEAATVHATAQARQSVTQTASATTAANLAVQEAELAIATHNATAASQQLTAAQGALAVAQSGVAAAGSILSKAMGFLFGPAGMFVLAGVAAYSLYEALFKDVKAYDALSMSTEDYRKKLEMLSKAEANRDVDLLTEALNNQKDAVKNAENKVSDYKDILKEVDEITGQHTESNDHLRGMQAKLAEEQRKLTDIEERLGIATEAAAAATNELGVAEKKVLDTANRLIVATGTVTTFLKKQEEATKGVFAAEMEETKTLIELAKVKGDVAETANLNIRLAAQEANAAQVAMEYANAQTVVNQNRVDQYKAIEAVGMKLTTVQTKSMEAAKLEAKEWAAKAIELEVASKKAQENLQATLALNSAEAQAITLKKEQTQTIVALNQATEQKIQRDIQATQSAIKLAEATGQVAEAIRLQAEADEKQIKLSKQKLITAEQTVEMLWLEYEEAEKVAIATNGVSEAEERALSIKRQAIQTAEANVTVMEREVKTAEQKASTTEKSTQKIIAFLDKEKQAQDAVSQANIEASKIEAELATTKGDVALASNMVARASILEAIEAQRALENGEAKLRVYESNVKTYQDLIEKGILLNETQLEEMRLSKQSVDEWQAKVGALDAAAKKAQEYQKEVFALNTHQSRSLKLEQEIAETAQKLAGARQQQAQSSISAKQTEIQLAEAMGDVAQAGELQAEIDSEHLSIAKQKLTAAQSNVDALDAEYRLAEKKARASGEVSNAEWRELSVKEALVEAAREAVTASQAEVEAAQREAKVSQYLADAGQNELEAKKKVIEASGDKIDASINEAQSAEELAQLEGQLAEISGSVTEAKEAEAKAAQAKVQVVKQELEALKAQLEQQKIELQMTRNLAEADGVLTDAEAAEIEAKEAIVSATESAIEAKEKEVEVTEKLADASDRYDRIAEKALENVASIEFRGQGVVALGEKMIGVFEHLTRELEGSIERANQLSEMFENPNQEITYNLVQEAEQLAAELEESKSHLNDAAHGAAEDLRQKLAEAKEEVVSLNDELIKMTANYEKQLMKLKGDEQGLLALEQKEEQNKLDNMRNKLGGNTPEVQAAQEAMEKLYAAKIAQLQAELEEKREKAQQDAANNNRAKKRRVGELTGDETVTSKMTQEDEIAELSRLLKETGASKKDSENALSKLLQKQIAVESTTAATKTETPSEPIPVSVVVPAATAAPTTLGGKNNAAGFGMTKNLTVNINGEPSKINATALVDEIARSFRSM